MARLYSALFACVIVYRVLSQESGSGPDYNSRNRLYSALRVKREVVLSTDLEDRIGNASNTNNHSCIVREEEICLQFSTTPYWYGKPPTCLKKVTAVKCMQEVNCWEHKQKDYYSKCVQQTAISDGKEYPSGCICELHANSVKS